MMKQLFSYARISQSLLLLMAAGTIAAAVEHFVPRADVIGQVFGVCAERLQSASGYPVYVFQHRPEVQ